MVPTPAPHPAQKPARKEGEDARERLLQAGLRLFAHQGFAKTSTRELAEAAAVNVAAISYYFGDKAGLYRAVFFEPLGDTADDLARFSDPTLTLGDALRGFYAGFLEPLRDGEASRLCMKLHFREMLEPTGLWDEEVAHGIRPLHEALLALLCREFGLAAADDDLLRLAICIAGLGVHLHVGRDVTDQLAPGLNAQPDAIDRWGDSLTRFSLAMVAAEHQRRTAAFEVTP
jgi:TetR/AcrR family transcriptional regulator, regulator of cefoperazone and chloramphenicol sensitivity